MNRPPATAGIVVMGVTGSGKSTLAKALAVALGWQFVEGDALHPPQNIAKMAAGLPLDDDDRWPFLERVADAIAAAQRGGVVVACSALKRSYRDFIRVRVRVGAGADGVTFVLPVIGRDALAARLAHRANHFMPPALLDSQLATFGNPDADEKAILIDGTLTTHAQVAAVIAALRAHGWVLPLA